jgi:microcystin-dependent protein
MDPFVGEIRAVPFNFAPKGWALCNGQLMPISQNTALFSLLGTQFGGDGVSTFGLPNLQGSSPLGAGSGPGLTPRVVGESGGEEAVTLIVSQMPAHGHGMHALSASATTGTPGTNVALAKTATAQVYRAATDLAVPGALAAAGASQSHDNRQPYLVLNFIIALQGVYPPRS